VSRNFLLATLLAWSGLVASDAALARNMYCCNDASGKLTCGDLLPAACYKRAYRIMDGKGRLVREVEAPLTPEQRAQREAEQVRRQAEEKRLAEEKRRNMALLATYPNEAEIDKARDRTLAEFDKASSDTRKRYDAAVKRRKKLDVEKEFYLKKPMPANLKKQIEDTDKEIETLKESLDGRKAEADALRDRYDEEKRRFMDLKYGKGRGGSAAPAPAAADKPPH